MRFRIDSSNNFNKEILALNGHKRISAPSLILCPWGRTDKGVGAEFFITIKGLLFLSPFELFFHQGAETSQGHMPVLFCIISRAYAPYAPTLYTPLCTK